MRVPWTTRRSNQLILKEIGPEYSLQGLMLKLKLPYFGHLMQTIDSLEKTLMLGKIESRRRRGRQRTRWSDGISEHEFEQIPGDGEGQGSLACCSSWGCRVGYDLVTEQQQLPQQCQGMAPLTNKYRTKYLGSQSIMYLGEKAVE